MSVVEHRRSIASAIHPSVDGLQVVIRTRPFVRRGLYLRLSSSDVPGMNRIERGHRGVPWLIAASLWLPACGDTDPGTSESSDESASPSVSADQGESATPETENPESSTDDGDGESEASHASSEAASSDSGESDAETGGSDDASADSSESDASNESDASGESSDDGDASSSSDESSETDGEGVRVAGVVSRSIAIDPEQDGRGTLYLGLMVSCDAMAETLFSTVVMSSDLSAAGAEVDFTIEDVEPGTYYLTGFLDDNLNATDAEAGPDKGDIVAAEGFGPACSEVVVEAADVDGVALDLNFIMPF